jgi:hypothetical protein
LTGKEILESAVEMFNGLELGSEKISLPLDPEMPLYGLRSPLDSLAFTALVMTLEDKLMEISGRPVNLTTQEIMDRAFSVFGTAGTLGAFLDGFNAG